MRSGPLEKIIREKLGSILAPGHMEVVNESPMHGLPLEAEKHFRLVIVSESFLDRSRIERHRLVNEILADEFKNGLHALSILAYTPDEWRAKGGETFSSPACLGGGKNER